MKHHNFLENIHTIAVIQTAFIGDIALTIPLLALLKKTFIYSNIVFITTPVGAELAQSFQEIDTIIVFDKKKKHRSFRSMNNLAKEISLLSLDILFVPHTSLRTNLLCGLIRYYSSQSIVSVGYKENALSWLLTKTIKKMTVGHEIEKLCSLFTILSGEKYAVNIFHSWNYRLNQSVVRIGDDIQQIVQHSVVLAPASVWKTKEWGKEKWIELARYLRNKGKNVVLIGSQADQELCESIAGLSGAVSLAGKTTLSQTLSVLQMAEVLISNDSAPAHLAYLAHCKVIMIYGPTVPEFGFFPPDPRSIIVQNSRLQCRPCHHHGKHICPLGTHECMKSIDVREIGHLIITKEGS
ncbi:MAG TPA: glycosyltransferase family 9 protein [Candidatus Kapabacteria bacterium]|jgi:heptosyltransferase-2|nr:glycosyltransferase family 9 protein [Candidatus Kapabacteria bacterium]